MTDCPYCGKIDAKCCFDFPEVPEWEHRFEKAWLGEWDKFNLEEIAKNFIREEFKKMRNEIVATWPDINEVFKKRGIY
jgi:hypothetical protein